MYNTSLDHTESSVVELVICASACYFLLLSTFTFYCPHQHTHTSRCSVVSLPLFFTVASHLPVLLSSQRIIFTVGVGYFQVSGGWILKRCLEFIMSVIHFVVNDQLYVEGTHVGSAVQWVNGQAF